MKRDNLHDKIGGKKPKYLQLHFNFYKTVTKIDRGTPQLDILYSSNFTLSHVLVGGTLSTDKLADYRENKFAFFFVIHSVNGAHQKLK